MRTVLATILTGFLFVTPLAAQETNGTLQKIKKSGEIHIGYRSSQPPISFVSKSGNPKGYSVDICKHIVTEIESKVGISLQVSYTPVTADNRFEALSSGKIDILCGSTTDTLARRAIVDFTQLTFITGGSYMALKGNKVRNNFDGKKIGVVKGSTTAVALKKLFEDIGTKVNFVLLDSADEGITALETNKIDIFSADQVVLLGLAVTSNNPDAFQILPDMFSYEPFALAVRRNDADFRLEADRVISKLYRSGEIEAIYARWFGTFSGEMSPALKAMIKFNTIPEE